MELHAEILKKNGRPEFAILPYDEYERLKELLENYEDLVDLRAAKAEGGRQYSLEEARSELGL